MLRILPEIPWRLAFVGLNGFESGGHVQSRVGRCSFPESAMTMRVAQLLN